MKGRCRYTDINENAVDQFLSQEAKRPYWIDNRHPHERARIGAKRRHGAINLYIKITGFKRYRVYAYVDPADKGVLMDERNQRTILKHVLKTKRIPSAEEIRSIVLSYAMGGT